MAPKDQTMKDSPISGSGDMASLSDSSGDKGAARRGLIGLNNLEYKLEPDLSVAVNCTDKNHYFQQQEYTNTQRAVCVLNSGADYVDPRRSLLCFTINLPDFSEQKFGVQFATLNGDPNPDPGLDAANFRKETISFGRKRPKANFYGKGTLGVKSAGGFTSVLNNSVLDDTNFQRGGSALNLIDRIVISSRSGDELARVERCNLLAYYMDAYMKDQQWMDTVGAAMGYNRTFEVGDINPDGTAAASPGDVENRRMRVAIPMYCLAGLFNYDRLLPSMLMSGLRIEITWASPVAAFVRETLAEQRFYKNAAQNDQGIFKLLDGFQPAVTDAADRRQGLLKLSGSTASGFLAATENEFLKNHINQSKVKSYTITDIYFQLKSVQLTDSIQRILNEHSAVNGLEIVYSDYNHTHAVSKSSSSFFAEVRHAASRALRAMMITRFQKNQDFQTADAFAASYSQFNNWHWRLGSLYFPHQPIKSEKGALENSVQTYMYTMDAIGKVAGAPRSGISYTEFLSTHEKQLLTGNNQGAFAIIGAGNAVGTGQQLLGLDDYTSHNMIGVSLERSTLFNLSGIPINNSRVLSFHGTIDSNQSRSKKGAQPNGDNGTDEEGQDLVHDIFLQYVRLARVFLNNVEVEQ
jgi:hypothetical protein